MACHGDSPKGLVKIIVLLYATTFKTSQNISEYPCVLNFESPDAYEFAACNLSTL